MPELTRKTFIPPCGTIQSDPENLCAEEALLFDLLSHIHATCLYRRRRNDNGTGRPFHLSFFLFPIPMNGGQWLRSCLLHHWHRTLPGRFTAATLMFPLFVTAAGEGVCVWLVLFSTTTTTLAFSFTLRF